MTKMTRQQMIQFDNLEFEFIQYRDRAMVTMDRLTSAVHRMAGDRKRGFGSSWTWSDRQAEEVLREMAAGSDEYNLSAMMRPSDLIAKVDESHVIIGEINAKIEAMENEYRASGGWQRYFPCLNADGHIHSSLRGCRTVLWDTQMDWATQYSGLTADQAIHGVIGEFDGLGETLCSVCFPGAPAQWCRSRSDLTRAEREAAKAEKDAAKRAALAVKNLAEPFKAYDGDRITTVAAAKALVRKPAETQVELEWNQTLEASRRWEDQESYKAFIVRIEVRLEAERKDAGEIGLILAAREAIVPGTGWSRDNQDKAFSDALKRNRKAWFR